MWAWLCLQPAQLIPLKCLLTEAMICRFDATELRSRAKKYLQRPDMPHLDKTFIAKNVQHLTSLGLIHLTVTS